jgi:hypothetical protein
MTFLYAFTFAKVLLPNKINKKNAMESVGAHENSNLGLLRFDRCRRPFVFWTGCGRRRDEEPGGRYKINSCRITTGNKTTENKTVKAC